jgi:hypothetical protein
VLVHLKQNDLFSKDLNTRIGVLIDMFCANRSVYDVIRAVKTQGTIRGFSCFEKPIMVSNDKASKDAIAEYIGGIVFKSIPHTIAIFSETVFDKLNTPPVSKPSIEHVPNGVISTPMKTTIATGSEPQPVQQVTPIAETITTEDALQELFASIPDEVEGDVDSDEMESVNPDELRDKSNDEVVEEELEENNDK